MSVHLQQPTLYHNLQGELYVNGEIVQRPPERQRRVDPQPQRHQDRPRYNDRTRIQIIPPLSHFPSHFLRRLNHRRKPPHFNPSLSSGAV
ncbi:hypothetical protein RJT34_24299 [Clitoria ternatea]|uniref:Uncharacterized protein n=1 Tax=Clitoria ternatea TaxID=43366 RepID=A0AAN9FMM9_CLITE